MTVETVESVAGSTAYPVPPAAPAVEATRVASQPEIVRSLLLGALGPAAVGACYGYVGGGLSMLTGAIGLPLAACAVVAFTLPGLYIAAAIAQVAPRATTLAREALDAFRRLGLTMLGLAPSLYFLEVSLSGRDSQVALVQAVVVIAAAVGLLSFRKAFAGRGLRGVFVFGGWAVISGSLAWSLFDRMGELL